MVQALAIVAYSVVSAIVVQSVYLWSFDKAERDRNKSSNGGKKKRVSVVLEERGEYEFKKVKKVC